MPIALPPFPLTHDVIESARNLTMTKGYSSWFRDLAARVQGSPTSAASSVRLTAQEASIGLTPLVSAATVALYRVTWYARITRAADVSSSLQVSIVTTEGGVVVTQSGTAITGNTTATVQSGSVLVRCDPGVPLQYATTYATAGATPMLYSLDLFCEAL